MELRTLLLEQAGPRNTDATLQIALARALTPELAREIEGLREAAGLSIDELLASLRGRYAAEQYSGGAS